MKGAAELPAWVDECARRLATKVFPRKFLWISQRGLTDDLANEVLARILNKLADGRFQPADIREPLVYKIMLDTIYDWMREGGRARRAHDHLSASATAADRLHAESLSAPEREAQRQSASEAVRRVVATWLSGLPEPHRSRMSARIQVCLESGTWISEQALSQMLGETRNQVHETFRRLIPELRQRLQDEGLLP